jgi:membrane protein YqaA with SNARE-associated domain
MFESLIYPLILYFGYIGIFIISAISASTIFLPTPLYLIVILASSLGMNPFLIALFSAAGMAIGELTGYFVGLGGKRLIESERNRIVTIFEKFFKKNGFITISLAAFFPVPFDIVGILAGLANYEIKKFILATFIGRFFKILIFALVGAEFKLI